MMSTLTFVCGVININELINLYQAHLCHLNSFHSFLNCSFLILPSSLGQPALLEMSKMEYFPVCSQKETCLCLCWPRVTPQGRILFWHTPGLTEKSE